MSKVDRWSEEQAAERDVDAKVKQGSALDHHARTNTTSVYTDARIFPMLPELLSTDLTSLNEGQERLAVVVDMTVDGDGQVAAGEIYRAVVVNRAKLAYNAVDAWLAGSGAKSRLSFSVASTCRRSCPYRKRPRSSSP